MGKVYRNRIPYAGGGNVKECTLAQYNTWKANGQLVPNTTYDIVDAPNLNVTANDLSYDGSATTTKQAIGDLATLTTTDKSSVVGAVNEVNGKTLKTLVKNITFGNATAGTAISLDLSTATEGAITSYTQVKMFSVMYVGGANNYDSGATVYCTDQNKLRLMPTITQNTVGARVCFIY